MCNSINYTHQPFRILSIDGGGIRGIIPAKGLSMLEEKLSREGKSTRICDYFDLICGTSTGAILAIGLALGIPAKEMLNLYLTKAKDIFPKKKSISKLWKGIIDAPIYDRTKLKELLEQTYATAMGNKTVRIGHCKTRICVPTYDVEKGEMHVFKTSHHHQFERDYHIPAHHIALASAAAPIYFDSYSFSYQKYNSKERGDYRYNVDGGIMANNPTLIGYIEAIKTLHQRPEDLRILSLATGDSLYSDNRSKIKMGIRYWLKNKVSFFAFYELISSAQSIYVDNIMKFLVSGAGTTANHEFLYERIQQKFANGKSIAMDKSDDQTIKTLEIIGHDLFQGKIKDIIEKFCFETKMEFIPDHKLE